ncbi:MAG: DMT family transporter [Candidatus Heimdallarchaeaceae archaeon]
MSVALGITLSFTAALAWGTGMVIFKVGVKNIDPLTATYVKGLLAVPILILVGLIVYGPFSLVVPFNTENLLWLLLSALFIALGDFFSLFALRKIDVSIAQPITTIYPFVTILLLLITNTEVIRWQIIVGTILIIFGVVTITYFSSKKANAEMNKEENQVATETKELDKINKKKAPILGIGLALLAAIFWGGTIFFTRKLLEDPNIEVISMMGIRNGLMVIMAFVAAISFSLIKNKGVKKLQSIQYKELGILMGGGVISWCIGGVSFFTAVGMIGAGISTPLSSISPFIVLLLGSIFLKEKIKLSQLIGVALIVGGAVLLSFTV